MSSLADRTILALRAEHDLLAEVAPTLTDDQLTGPSGASEWTVAQVLSHLGSGAQIGLAGLRAALGEAPPPAADFNQGVWDRWNAMSPQEQRAGFLEHDAEVVAAFEALTPEQRESVELELGFLPFPLPVGAFAGLRLNEVAQHSWDVRVAVDAGATVTGDSATALVEQFADRLGFLLGFIGKAGQLAEPTVLDLGGSGYGVSVDEGVTIVSPVPAATAVFDGPLEAAVRLIGGRLTPAHTPEGLTVTGNVTLEDLRRIFPGY